MRERLLWWATGLGLVALFLAFALWEPAPAGGPDFCLMHRVTGIACPGCGLTRAAAAFAKGHFAESWRWHPLFAVLAGEALLYWLLHGAAVRQQRLRGSAVAGAWLARFAPKIALGTGVLLLIVWVVRFASGTLPA
ncbi:MAG: DUF2752 domain-containing protein [Thermoanaerobaculia bacterium]